jgi:ABC-2 family transporter protein
VNSKHFYSNKFHHYSYAGLFKTLEKLQIDRKLLNFHVVSKTLDDLYKSVENEGVSLNGNGHMSNNNNNNNVMETIDLRKTVNGLQNNLNQESKIEKTSFMGIVKKLFWKRFLHFRRNYKLLVCILVLPVIFEMIAMGFMTIRPPGDHENSIKFSRSMYPDSFEFYSSQNANAFAGGLYEEFESQCVKNENCYFFDTSKDSFDWTLKTHEEFIGRRYGGVSINESRSIVWYNNKGYHSMPLYLNLLHSAVLKRELNDSSHSITTYNHPLKLGEEELSVSSM